MITHIVLWKLHRLQDVPAMQAQLASLAETVPGIQKLSVGVPASPEGPMAHISLYSEFQSWEDLETYKQHPAHLKVVDFIKPLVRERMASDYETA